MPVGSTHHTPVRGNRLRGDSALRMVDVVGAQTAVHMRGSLQCSMLAPVLLRARVTAGVLRERPDARVVVTAL